jgi:RNA polymerase sigma-70 factor (ECF subfamily)
VFLEVWRRARAFEGRAQVSTWLLAIARNRGLDMIRRSPHEPLDKIEHIMDDADSPEALVQKRQAASVLAKALHHLSPAHREIIDLVYYHERSIDEVAGILNIPSGTVKTRMFYARTRLAKLLRGGGQDAPQLLA